METRYIERSITDKFLEASKYFPVIVVTGPRQSGKTTLISHIFNDYPLFSLEDLDVRQLAKEDPKFFLNQSSTGMIIDEAQNVPEIFSYIQSFVDNNPKKKFILSGSSNFSLLKSITQSLAGRAAIFNLMPFSLDEISGFCMVAALTKYYTMASIHALLATMCQLTFFTPITSRHISKRTCVIC